MRIDARKPFNIDIAASSRLADGDVQLQRAVAELPKAKALADDIRRLRAAARGDRRN